jgi:hypothetical protein
MEEQTTTSSLQLLIEKKAEKRLDEDILAMVQRMRTELLFKSDELLIKRRRYYGKDAEPWEKATISSLQEFLSSQSLKTQLKDIHMSQYIAEETEVLIKTVERLTMQMENLQNEVGNLQR